MNGQSFQQPGLPPMPSNLTSPAADSTNNQIPSFEIKHPETASTPPGSSTDSLPVTKILTAVIPVFVFAVTGIVSYSIVNNSQQKMTYQSSAAEPTKTTQQSNFQPVKSNMLDEASVSGCIYSFRFDGNASGSANLKQEAQTELAKIKTRLEKGEKGEDVLFEILNGMTKTENEARLKLMTSDRNLYLSKYGKFQNQFNKFQTNNSINFCFNNTNEVNTKVGESFLAINRDFIKNFPKIDGIVISDLFTINKNSGINSEEYALMFILKN